MYSSVLCLLKEICDLTYYYVELEQVITNQAIKFTTQIPFIFLVEGNTPLYWGLECSNPDRVANEWIISIF